MGSGREEKLHAVHLAHCEEMTAKVLTAMEPGSPGGEIITPEEGLGLLTYSVQTVTPGAQEMVLIERVRDAVGTTGVIVVMEEDAAPRLETRVGKNLWYELRGWLAVFGRWRAGPVPWGRGQGKGPTRLHLVEPGVEQSGSEPDLSLSS